MDLFPHQELAANPHHRVGERRHDEAWLRERWASTQAQVVVIAGTRLRPESGTVPWLPATSAPEGERILLGERDGRSWWAVLVDPATAAGDREEWIPLRAALTHLAGDLSVDAPMLFHAIGLAEWRWATRFCPRCGGALLPRAAGHELVCQGCGKTQFPRTDPAVIMTVVDGEPGSPEERCLLGRQAVWPQGRFSTLAGFVEPGESLEDAVRREVAEETGIRVGRVDYFGNQAWPFPQSLMLGMIGRAESTEITIDEHELDDARWFTRAELRDQAEAGSVLLPRGVSISRSLIEAWYGGPLPGSW